MDTLEMFSLTCSCGKKFTPHNDSKSSVEANGLRFDFHTKYCKEEMKNE